MNWIYIMIFLIILLPSAALFLLHRRRRGKHINSEILGKSEKKMAPSGTLLYAGIRKNKGIQYLLFLICLHSICILFTFSKFLFLDWGKWLIDTRFLNSSFSVYIGVIIAIFPLLSVLPYCFVNDFPNVSRTKKVILAALTIGNEVAVLTYTTLIHYWLGI